MPTLSALVSEQTALDVADVEWLHRLLAEWQLVSDLSFADLILWVRAHDTAWLAVAHMRPTTGPTTHPEDVVGSVLRGDRSRPLDLAWQQGRLVRDTDHGWAPLPVSQEAVPVRREGHPVAVLTRDTHRATTRTPSQLELAYLSSAGELLQMVSEGTFPYPGQTTDPEGAPRVGDGFLRLDRTGHVVYASPNALSASRRLGVAGDLLGAHLGQTIAGLPAPEGTLDEPRGSAALAAALRLREPRDSEVEAQGATVLLRAMPLLPGGEPRGALVLLRDVTEVRRRDRQLMGKDATIREIHHRVKNNLQTVAALLRLQARRLSDPSARAALEESVRRVSSIAVVHERLSLTLDGSVDVDGIADQVLAMCSEIAAPEAGVQVTRDGSFGQLDAEVATPLSMVLNELVQNAVEHAGAAHVVVRPARTTQRLVMQVDDDGRGMPDGFDPATSGRLGLQIVRTLLEGELRATLSIQERPGGGTRMVVEVPLRPQT